MADARRLASKFRVEIDTGVDVASVKRKSKLASRLAKSFRDVSESYMSLAATELKESTRDETRRYLDKDILPRIGHLDANEVLEPEIIDLITKVANRSHSVARRTFEIVSVIMSFAVAKHLLRRNPCATLKISALIGQSRPKRARIMLTEDEIKVVLLNATELGVENALMLKILLATCTRKGELLQAKWDDIDFEQGIWRIPAENSKNAKAFDIPLATPVVGWLNELRGLSGKSAYVLPSRKNGYRRKGLVIPPFLAAARSRVG